MATHFALAVACLLLGAPRYEQATMRHTQDSTTPAEAMINFDLVASAEAAPIAVQPQAEAAVPTIRHTPAPARHRRVRAVLPPLEAPAALEPAKESEPTDTDDEAGEVKPSAAPAPEVGATAPLAGAAGLTAATAGRLPTPPASPVAARVDQPSDVTPSEATYLRTYETFPSLPRSLWVTGRVYNVMTRVCVSAEGRVSGVAVRSGAEPELDQLLVSTMRSWRYRPRLVDGAARPFCHLMKVQYAVR
jgi:protein TonB